MANQVFINDEGFIEMVIVDELNRESLFASLKEILKLNDTLSSQEKPIRTLVNLTKMTTMDVGGGKLSELSLGSIAFDRLAIYGANEQSKDVILAILKTVKDQSKVKYFEHREEAIYWLL